MSQTTSPWRVRVALSDIPENGRHFDLVADEPTRADVAKFAGLRTLPRLEATFDVHHKGTSLRVTGRVIASVGQTCVVTLEPVESEVVEKVDVVFAPGPSVQAPDRPLSIESSEAEAPEPLVGDSLDLGALATEFLILGIDPYPRKPGATFDPPHTKDDPSTHPFAALAALKKDKGGGKDD